VKRTPYERIFYIGKKYVADVFSKVNMIKSRKLRRFRRKMAALGHSFEKWRMRADELIIVYLDIVCVDDK